MRSFVVRQLPTWVALFFCMGCCFVMMMLFKTHTESFGHNQIIESTFRNKQGLIDLGKESGRIAGKLAEVELFHISEGQLVQRIDDLQRRLDKLEQSTERKKQ